jgi:hexulose-6-phosphate isomerase
VTAWPTSITLRAFPPSLPLERALEAAREAGFDAVEVNLEPGLTHDLDSSDDALRALAEVVAANDLGISAVYSREQWRHPLTSGDPETVARGRRVVLRLAGAAHVLGVDAVLVVPGGVDMSLFGGDEVVPYGLAYERAQRELSGLARELEARDVGVSLCVENVWNKFLLSPLETRRFVDEIGHPLVGVYFDVGNVLRHGYPEQWLRILGPRVRRVHLKDYRTAVGTEHGFTGLLQGDVDWPAVMDALREIDYRSYLTVEVLPAYAHDPVRLAYDAGAAVRTIAELGSPWP